MKPYANFPGEKIEEVRHLAREGFSVREICRRVGTHHHNVRPIVAELEAAGDLPLCCPCGLPRGHRSTACAVSTAPKRGYPKIRDSKLTKAQIKEIHDLAAKGVSNRQIAERTGRALVAVNRHVKIWMQKLEEAGAPLKPCKCGRPARHPGGCIKNSPTLLSSDRVERIERWAREGVSAAEMQRRSRAVTNGAGLDTILKYARPIWAQMAADGHVCGCGEAFGHAAPCKATWDAPGRIRGPQSISPDSRRRIINALLNGDSIVAIRRRLQVSEKKVLRVFRAMSREDRHRRAKLVWQRVHGSGERQQGLDLFARIRRAVPSGLEQSLRDDVTSELYLAVLQGDITIDAIERHARTYVGRAFTLWASAFGPQSLDAPLGTDDDRSLADLIGDDSYLDELADIQLGDD
ncbi:transposase [Novosphingobium chloroacetimidivorans]|uniref:Transposase n=1 Tax=Novosphingobium chloroacetimidivorans TaxID=1428314 RepID=A0A7W7K6L5_9SPHN|nr:hypothetical protein [Novosphingobium chloroacetimidivorans]MBB4857207.1 transposase [Novosphingobium chloroacetimidivorans]